MAKQTGDIKITGTVDDICFYRMEGGYCARLKSSLTGKRFWREKAFAGSRRSCRTLGQASPLASRLYRTLPKEQKSRDQFRTLTGRVKLLLREGWEEAGIEAWFRAVYFPQGTKPTANNSKAHKKMR